MDLEIQKELNNIKNDKIINAQVIDNFKEKLSKELLEGNLGYEVRNCNSYINVKYKKKNTLKMKLNKFIKRLIITLGFGNNGIR